MPKPVLSNADDVLAVLLRFTDGVVYNDMVLRSAITRLLAEYDLAPATADDVRRLAVVDMDPEDKAKLTGPPTVEDGLACLLYGYADSYADLGRVGPVQ